MSSLILTPLERPFWERMFESAFVAAVHAKTCDEPFKAALAAADAAIDELRRRYRDDHSDVLRRSTCPRCHHQYDVR